MAVVEGSTGRNTTSMMIGVTHNARHLSPAIEASGCRTQDIVPLREIVEGRNLLGLLVHQS